MDVQIPKNKLAAEISVEWGYDLHSVILIPKNWKRVLSGEKLSIYGDFNYWEGECYRRELWTFGGGLDGDLIVEYGTDGGTGFIGTLSNADITEYEYISKNALNNT